ncbi:DUF5004 domain-containing protein [Bacteroides reticulotermitis]|uniref:DUF5004 domain-containing protein n=1 Tax=Bacteroides reticulotermitis TaxID=1133319 RepID=UPI003A8A2DEE
MKLNMRFVIGAFLTLALSVSSCDTFKDEMSLESYSEATKHIDGNWQLSAVSRNGVDITKYMDFTRFRIVLNKDNTYEMKNYLPFIVRNNGTWQVDDPLYPFHLSFKEEGTNKDVKTEIGFLTVDGERRLTIKLSPGCYTNKYLYTFKQVAK